MADSKQITPLPCSGGDSCEMMNETNEKLTMMIAQASADKVYDPPPPPYITEAKIINGFCNNDTTFLMMVLGGLFIVYGIVAK